MASETDAVSTASRDKIRIVSWNVGMRGIVRTVACDGAKNIDEFLDKLGADILCLQETKLSSRSDLPSHIAFPQNYVSYFALNRVKNRPYSGTATFVRKTLLPERVYEGPLLPHGGEFDTVDVPADSNQINREGRVLVTEHKDFTLLNVYCPARSEHSSRNDFKWEFHKALQHQISTLQHCGHSIIVTGDLNVAHKRADHCDPESWEIESGMKFEEDRFRMWMDELTSAEGENLTDAFRYYFPRVNNRFSCWNTMTRARETNYGTRLDYSLISSELSPKLVYADVLSHYEGSDHCPVSLDLSIGHRSSSIGSTSDSAFCPHSWNEFLSEQTSMRSFLQKAQGKRASERTSEPAQEKKSRRKAATATLDLFIRKQSPLPQSNSSDKNGIIRDSIDLVSEEQTAKNTWANLLSGPIPPPKCSGHNETSVERTVKSGKNIGRNFFVCNRPAGRSDDSSSRCNFFMWKSTWKTAYRSRAGSTPNSVGNTHTHTS
eukprot:gb/GECG01002755.1/.p1 GENE.gb/GECG01002755.1/~~gb/GECG01002755.1/.p1  ORF type:complete len:490 (+),score=41.91 gb/GECG01002755.1/:1-1470(+)